jgi:hypothetical protein
MEEREDSFRKAMEEQFQILADKIDRGNGSPPNQTNQAFGAARSSVRTMGEIDEQDCSLTHLRTKIEEMEDRFEGQFQILANKIDRNEKLLNLDLDLGT